MTDTSPTQNAWELLPDESAGPEWDAFFAKFTESLGRNHPNLLVRQLAQRLFAAPNTPLPGCNQCPHDVGDSYERDCDYPRCSPGPLLALFIAVTLEDSDVPIPIKVHGSKKNLDRLVALHKGRQREIDELKVKVGEETAYVDFLAQDFGNHVVSLGPKWYWRRGHGWPIQKMMDLRAAIKAAMEWVAKK